MPRCFELASVRVLGTVVITVVVAAVLWVGVSVSAQPTGFIVTTAPDGPERIAQIARDVDRARSLRAVKDLQILQSQYAQVGLWDEVSALFTESADVIDGDKIVAQGHAAITQYLRQTLGAGKNGLPLGALHAEILYQPVVRLTYDGRGAVGRWSALTLDGQFGGASGGRASLLGGKQVNDYVRDNGVWKISRLHFFQESSGTYETGLNATPGIPLAQIPYGYTPGQAGRPVPDEPSGSDLSVCKDQSLAETERLIDRMNDQDAVRTLQMKYGYYIDRKMWSDVTDLFVADGVLEIAGQGVWSGVKSIRRALEVDGPEGLQRGQVNDHIQSNPFVTVDPNGTEAQSRGFEFGMLTPKLGEAYFLLATFSNRFVKGADGTWRFREMRLYPKMKADYFQGWGKSSVVDPRPEGLYAPDKPSSAENSPQVSNALPAFPTVNPATGRSVSYQAGARVVGNDRLLPAPQRASPAPSSATTLARLLEARRKLNVAKAFDAVENISNALGYYLDDADWDDFVSLFAVDGTRPQGPGFYVGRDHIYRAMTEAHFNGPTTATSQRRYLDLHTRMQPALDISPDARTALIRTRLFLIRLGTPQSSGFNSGIYPSDTAVLEDGVWKMKVGGEIDETYFSSRSWKEGWANPKPPAAPSAPSKPWHPGDAEPVSDITNTIDFPPDIPRALYNNDRLKDMATTNWPDIKPMWFAYRNPVSNRVPPHFCAQYLDCY